MTQEHSDTLHLSVEQRLELLEEKVGSNKLGLFAIALVLIIIISVAATVGILKLTAEEQAPSASAEQAAKLEQSLNTLQEQVFNLDTKMVDLEDQIKAQNDKISASSNQILLQLMIEKEQDVQNFFNAMRAGMYDLSHMVPGSRSWLELYNEQLDAAERKSAARSKRLQALEAGAASGFEDF